MDFAPNLLSRAVRWVFVPGPPRYRLGGTRLRALAIDPYLPIPCAVYELREKSRNTWCHHRRDQMEKTGTACWDTSAVWTIIDKL